MPKNGLRNRQEAVCQDVVPVTQEVRIRPDIYFNNQVSRRATVFTLIPFPGEPKILSMAYALRNLY